MSAGHSVKSSESSGDGDRSIGPSSVRHHQQQQQLQKQQRSRNNSTANSNNKVPVNWSDMLPPPPRHPPPPSSPAPLSAGSERNTLNNDGSLAHASTKKTHANLSVGCASPALSKRSAAGSFVLKKSQPPHYHGSVTKNYAGSTSSKDPSSGSSNSRQRTSAGGVQPAPVDRAGYAKSSSSSSVGGRWIVNESDAERRLLADLDPERRQPPCSPAPTAPRPRDLARPKASPPAVAAFPDADLVLHDFSDVDSYYAPAHSLSYGELEYHDKIQDLSAYRPENTASEWDCEDYSRSASQGSETEDDLASSVYDNSPVYRPQPKIHNSSPTYRPPTKSPVTPAGAVAGAAAVASARACAV